MLTVGENNSGAWQENVRAALWLMDELDECEGFLLFALMVLFHVSLVREKEKKGFKHEDSLD